LVEACIVAAGIARPLGNTELAVRASERATAAAALTGQPDLVALTAMARGGGLLRLGARRRAGTVLDTALDDTAPAADPTARDTAPARGYGMLH